MFLSQLQKYWNNIFIISNLLFIVFDVALLALPIRTLDVLANYNIILDYFKPVIFPVVIFTAILGLLSVFIGFIGLWKKKTVFILVHIVGLTIATLIEISISIRSNLRKNQFFKVANQSLWNSIQYYEKHPNYENQMDNLQREFDCCGVKSYTDYKRTIIALPISCKTGNSIHSKGCAEALYEYIQHCIMIIIYICITFAIIKAIYLATSILLYRKSDKNNISA
ncbi:unnamed protein product [Schistosoma rodhaini]|uniref:Tetraspanin n=1 Tax=Schistosoma rodhaini TaxID=6188 RepID=A0AA85ETI7_9TREM|nr:unnamed protein product [Schistosoma rodhaini]CAH8492925.1 unnamed protein product [Schistosoma rodhaini]